MKNLLFILILFAGSSAFTQSEITGSKFREMLTWENDKVYVFEFYADWCGYCTWMKPQVNQLATSYSDVGFYRIDGDATYVDDEMGLDGYPQYLLIQNGQLLDRVVGADIEQLTSHVQLYSDSGNESGYQNASVTMQSMNETQSYYDWSYHQEPTYFYLYEDDSEEVWFTVSANETVEVVATCDSDCVDIDLKIYDEYGNLVDSDLLIDASPIVNITNQSSIRKRFKAVAVMENCDEAPCHAGVAVFHESE